MVPTGSASEWYTGGNSFIEHTPPGVSLAVCTCSLPWGGTINDGSGTTAYQAATVACGGSCTSQTRTCTGTSLSGSYQYSSCSAPCASCSSQGVSWSSCSGTAGALAHGGSTSVSNTASGYTGSVTVTCNNGSLSQSGASCTASCLPGGSDCSNNAQCCNGLCMWTGDRSECL